MSPASLSTAKSSFTVPTTDAFRFEQHLVIGVVGNRAAGGQCRQPRAAPPAQHAVDRVTVQHRRRAVRGASLKPSASMRNDVGEDLAREVAIRPARRTARTSRLRSIPCAATSADDLLREHIERLVRDDEPVQFAATDAHRSARRTRRARRAKAETGGPWACRRRCDRSARRVAGSVAIDRGEPSWQTRSTSPISMPSSSEAVATIALQLAALQALLGVEPLFLGEAAVMRGDAVIAEAFGRACASRVRPCGAC